MAAEDRGQARESKGAGAVESISPDNDNRNDERTGELS
jgi:hypothetical protein